MREANATQTRLDLRCSPKSICTCLHARDQIYFKVLLKKRLFSKQWDHSIRKLCNMHDNKDLEIVTQEYRETIYQDVIYSK